MNKKMFGAVATAALVGTSLTGVAAVEASGDFPFKDVAVKDRADVQFLIENGITVGIKDDYYGSAEYVKRGQMAKFLGRALDLVTIDGDDKAIDEIKKAGIAKGYKDGSFGAGDPITRAQMATMLVNAFPELKEVEGKDVVFTDVSDKNSHSDAIKILAKSGVTVGNGVPGHFGPNEFVTRKQMAAFIHRAFTITNQYEFTDNGDNTATVKTLTAGKIHKDSVFVHGTTAKDPVVTISEDGKVATVDFGDLDHGQLTDVSIKIGASKFDRGEVVLKDTVAPTVIGDIYKTGDGDELDFTITFSEGIQFDTEEFPVLLYKDGAPVDVDAKAEAIIYPDTGDTKVVLRIKGFNSFPAYDTIYLYEDDNPFTDKAGNKFKIDGRYFTIEGKQ